VGLYPHARKVGDLLFLSGVGPRTAGSDANDSGVPGLELDHNGNFKSFDFEAQVHSVFANVKAILEASGSSWEKLVDVTVFLVDMKRDFPHSIEFTLNTSRKTSLVELPLKSIVYQLP
jgi:2-aminomuconate deaminase